MRKGTERRMNRTLRGLSQVGDVSLDFQPDYETAIGSAFPPQQYADIPTQLDEGYGYGPYPVGATDISTPPFFPANTVESGAIGKGVDYLLKFLNPQGTRNAPPGYRTPAQQQQSQFASMLPWIVAAAAIFVIASNKR